MKITFLVPPPLDGKKVADRVAGCAYGLYPMPNVFELTAAAVAEREGHIVKYMDFPIHRWSPDRFEDFLANDRSDVYLLYTVNLTGETDRIAAEKIRIVRGDEPTIIFYGPAPTYEPENFLADENMFVIRGEPESTLAELLRALDKESGKTAIDGISYREDGKIEHAHPRALIDDLDSLPFPARHLLDRSLYYNPKLGVRPFTTAYGSRNCPHKCLYCVPCSLSFARELEYRRYNDGRKPPIRLRSAENIIEEFRLLKTDGYRSATFLDDQFLWDENRTMQICEGIRDTGIIWGCASRADRITERVARAMAAAGCRFIDIGVESFDQRILDYIRKDLKVDEIERAIRAVRQAGISAKVNILLGCSPLETKETIAHNLRQIARLGVDQVMFNISNPFPGTEFYEIAKKEGWLVHGNYVPSDVQKEAIINLPHLSAEQLVREVRRANLAFFLNPRFILKNITRFRSPAEWRDAMRSLKRKLF
ncbi:MAG: radical SAM protein [bacterium]